MPCPFNELSMDRLRPTFNVCCHLVHPCSCQRARTQAPALLPAEKFGNASKPTNLLRLKKTQTLSVQQRASSSAQAPHLDMPRPSFNVPLNPCSIIAPSLLQRAQADAENSEMLRAFNDCSNFC
jgi:hypothetical protein